MHQRTSATKSANSRSLATASFALTSRVIAAMVELDKRYAENVGDVVL
jgi:hypothetical protein